MGWTDWAEAATTGGIFGGGDAGSTVGLMSGYGPAAGLLGVGKTPNNYDANGQLKKSEDMSGTVYDQSLAQNAKLQASGAPTGQINVPVNMQVPKAVNAQTIGTPDVLAGKAATDLRQQQLSQAATAANSPSAAAAQMGANQQAIAHQQLGVAAGARGADRATARRDAMLGIGNGGQQASATTAALAATEQAQKQQAYSQALAGVSGADVAHANAQTTIGAQNQGADLQAQNINAANQLNMGQFGVNKSLEAQEASATNALGGFNANQNWQNATNQTALQAVGATNQAAGVASGYGQSQNQAATQNKGALMGALGSIGGALISDERAKDEIEPVGGWSSASADHGSSPTSPYGASQNFLDWQPPKPTEEKQSGGLLSDARAKRDVASMGDADFADWAESVPLSTWRYKPGVPGTDNGDDYHVGPTAQALESTGPVGKLLVHERKDGLKEIDAGNAGLVASKGALARADEALEWAKAAYAHATGRMAVR